MPDGPREKTDFSADRRVSVPNNVRRPAEVLRACADRNLLERVVLYADGDAAARTAGVLRL